MRVDAHVHIWDASSQAAHADHPLPSDLPASAEDLLGKMNAARVDAALVVQPINYLYDYSYILQSASAHPTRLYPIALADTTQSPEVACDQLRILVREHNMRGVRINPNLAKGSFHNATVRALARTAGDLSIPAALFARPEHLISSNGDKDGGEVRALMADAPNTDFVLDHFALCDMAQHVAAQSAVLNLATHFPRLHVKASAWFRVSNTSWPHSDLRSLLRQLIGAVGAPRILFGSDFPYVIQHYDYIKANSVLDTSGLTTDECRWVAGDSAARLYKLE